MKDLVNNRFGRLTVISFNGRNKGYDSVWKCLCDCGSELIVRGGVLKNGHTQSCGCLQIERASISHTKHGLYYDKATGKRSKLYKVWGGMIARCYNPKTESYKYYGGKGIKVNPIWHTYYGEFHKWAIDSGYKEGLSIDRINNQGNYEPSNCRWATNEVQSRNRSNHRFLTLNGDSRTVIDWGNIMEIPYRVLNQRSRRGWSDERTLTTKL